MAAQNATTKLVKVTLAHDAKSVSMTGRERTLVIDCPPSWHGVEDRHWLQSLCLTHSSGKEIEIDVKDAHRFKRLYDAMIQRRERESAEAVAQSSTARLAKLADVAAEKTTVPQVEVKPTTTEQEVQQRVDKAQARINRLRAKGELYQLEYDIPVVRSQATLASDRIDSPCLELYRAGWIPSSLSGWIGWQSSVSRIRGMVADMERTMNVCICIRTGNRDRECSPWQRKGGCRCKVRLTRVHPDEVAGAIRDAERSLQCELQEMHTSLITVLNGIQERVERDSHECQTERELRAARGRTDGRIRAELRNRQERLNAIVSAAESFEATEEIADLVRALSMAIDEQRRLFNEDAERRGVKGV